jgi:tRNA(fMet)-specific endonuclease VapC
LFYGAYKSARIQENLAKVNELVSISAVLVCDAETARQYGVIKNMLRVKGRPIPENDIWIASITLQYDLILVTRDSHFKEIDNLLSVHW